MRITEELCCVVGICKVLAKGPAVLVDVGSRQTSFPFPETILTGQIGYPTENLKVPKNFE